MRIINGKSLTDDEFHVVSLSEPTRIEFIKQIENIIISSPDGDILIGWDYTSEDEFTPNNCMLLREGDKMKNLSKERITHFYMMPKESGKTLTVYVTAEK